MIDTAVETSGQTVTVEYITEPVFEHDVVSWPKSETETVETKAIVSSIDEKDVQRLEGRVSGASVKLVVPSDADVRHDRHPARDRLYFPKLEGWGSDYGEDYGTGDEDSRLFEVVDVEEIEHPFVGVTKKTVFAKALDGHR